MMNVQKAIKMKQQSMVNQDKILHIATHDSKKISRERVDALRSKIIPSAFFGQL